MTRDGRGARTVTVKLKKADMSTLTRSATLPYATGDAATLTATAHRLLLDPYEIGPIRLLGVGFSGLSDVRQESLFPELEQYSDQTNVYSVDEGRGRTDTPGGAVPSGWRVGDDVSHPGYGHGWVQGAGHGVVSVRFETRSTGPGVMRTFGIGDGDLTAADPVDSLDWPDYLCGVVQPPNSTPAGDDIPDR